MSQNKLKKQCHSHFIHYLRIREWRDVYRQIKSVIKNDRQFSKWDVSSSKEAVMEKDRGICHPSIYRIGPVKPVCLLKGKQPLPDSGRPSNAHVSRIGHVQAYGPGCSQNEKKPQFPFWQTGAYLGSGWRSGRDFQDLHAHGGIDSASVGASTGKASLSLVLSQPALGFKKRQSCLH